MPTPPRPATNTPAQSQAAAPRGDDSREAFPREMVTKSFSLYAEDVRRIRQVNDEDELNSESAALRQLLRDGWRWRELRRRAEARLLAEVGGTEE